MDIVSSTNMPAAVTMGRDPDGRERVVVVVKGTFVIPTRGEPLTLADEQDDFVYADTFTGKPGFSAVLDECEFAPMKPRCDVLLTGSAHAPGGGSATSVFVGLRVGAMSKGFEVVGDRHWTAGVVGIRPSSPTAFRAMPITYDRAFGGPGEPVDGNPALSNAYGPNPVGVGYFKRARDKDVFGKRVPNTQEQHDPIASPGGDHRPMSFGPIGRNFDSRIPLGGTYDQKWQDEIFPFLPPNFDAAYYQAAPIEQQIPYPVGGEPVQLLGLTAQEIAPFQLFDTLLPVEISNVDYQRVEQNAALDTVVLQPDRMRMSLVWRTSLPLKRNMHEITQVVIGRMPKGWYRARNLGKTYYPSLGALVTAGKGA